MGKDENMMNMTKIGRNKDGKRTNGQMAGRSYVCDGYLIMQTLSALRWTLTCTGPERTIKTLKDENITNK